MPPSSVSWHPKGRQRLAVSFPWKEPRQSSRNRQLLIVLAKTAFVTTLSFRKLFSYYSAGTRHLLNGGVFVSQRGMNNNATLTTDAH
jgi:hypothetical protein